MKHEAPPTLDIVRVHARFWAKVDVTGFCWNWTGSTGKKGHGYAWDVRIKRTVGAHRLAYELLVGPIPEGLELDHLCRNPSCINPDHLEPVTHAENVRRGFAGVVTGYHGRQVTHCPQGHEYTPENTYRPARGTRHCRECVRRRNKAWKAKRKAEADAKA